MDCIGQLVAGCTEPEPEPPTGQCTVNVRNEPLETSPCPALTANQEPVEGCDCYNYCDGEFIGCAGYGEFRQVFCETELVAGCPLGADEEEEQETGICLISASTAECPPLVQGVTPVEDCDCYDFCGGEYVGCCAYGEFCGLLCDVEVVAGCQLDNNGPEEGGGGSPPSQAPFFFWPGYLSRN